VSRIDEAMRRKESAQAGNEAPSPTEERPPLPARTGAAPAGSVPAADDIVDPWQVAAGTAGASTPGAAPSPATKPADGGVASAGGGAHIVFRAEPADVGEPWAATVPSARVVDKLNVANSTLPQSVVEQYRRLAASLHHAQADRGIKTVMACSALGGEGKSLTATNLALTLSGSYRRRVLLVDADLRRPSLAKAFELPETAGLSDGLLAGDDRPLPVTQINACLALLPAGRPTHDPVGPLTSNRMRHIIGEAREAFDWVIIDTPPIALLTDASLLGAMVDTAVLVVRAGYTPLAAVKKALQTVGRQRVIGLVLNRVTSESHHGYDYAYYGRHYGTD
jgi:capsular exopolysaccharide synthesis family protein